jgi:hypothetical protein
VAYDAAPEPLPDAALLIRATTTKRKQAIMSQHDISFNSAELAHVETRTAKSGNTYASGILILRDESGKFEASLKFRSFNAVDTLRALELQYFAKEAAQPDNSGGDLHFVEHEAESTETRDRTVAKATARPQVDVSGWFRTTKSSNGKWDTAFMVESVSI